MSFAEEVQRFIDRTNMRANTVVKRVILSIGREVIRKSPVGNPDLWVSPAPPGYVGGRFKGNWQLGVGVAPEGTVDIHDEDGGGTLAHIALQIPEQAAGKVYYITNNMPYAQALEDGHSSQSAPGNMVAGTVADFQRYIRQAAQE